MMKMNKKGWIRIVEAFIAVILILIVLLSIRSMQKTSGNNDNLEKVIDAILDEIANNNNLRQNVLSGNLNSLNEFVADRIPNILEFKIQICGIEDICNLPEYKPEVYARERIISSTLSEYNPKKIKIFVWEGAREDKTVQEEIAAESKCSDGTSINNCNLNNKPKYCNAEKQQVDNCGLCGCSAGQECKDDGECEISKGIKLTECGSLTQSNSIYYLDSDITAFGTCFDIQADNVVLDCEGHKITKPAYSFDYGINIVNHDSITIKNCTIFSSFLRAISIENSKNSQIISNTILLLNTNNFGIWLEGAKNNEIRDNNITSRSNEYNGVGIYLNKNDDGNVIQYNNMEKINSGITLYNYPSRNIINNQISYNKMCSLKNGWDFNCVYSATSQLLNNVCSGKINGCGEASAICPTAC